MGTQKIDGSRLETLGIVIALFQIADNNKKSHFFKVTFLLTDINIGITLA